MKAAPAHRVRTLIARCAAAAAIGPIAAAQCAPSDELAPIGATAGAEFGRSVAVDGEIAVVGAHLDDGEGLDAGAAFVFRWGGGAWTQEAHLVAPNTSADDFFGFRTAVAGDVVVIGAPRDALAAPKAGSANVFRFSSGAWAHEATLTASDPDDTDELGLAVAMSVGVILAAAPNDDEVASNAGAAYIFRDIGGGAWVEEAKLTAPDGAAGALFGIGTAIDGDVALVGAPNDMVRGAAYVFRRTGGVWAFEQKLVAPNAANFDAFGGAVALRGDVALVGARFGGVGGSAYVFRRTGGAWTYEAELLPDDAVANDSVGSFVALGEGVALLGAPGHDAGGPDRGAAYVFRFNGASWTQTAKLTAAAGAVFDRFGAGGGLSADHAVIGAPGADAAGIAYAFDGLANACVAPEDLNGDGMVDGLDLGQLLGNWGPCPGCPADLNGDGVVNGLDLGYLLGAWG